MTDTYQRELRESAKMRWHSYVYYRRKPYNGTHINVDAEGVRYTAFPPADAGRITDLPIVWCFGGSAMWGTGASDTQTIPSHIANNGYRVINLAETGYVFTQELITLMLTLRKYPPPDIAIFYSGVNDVFSAYQNGIGGLPANEYNRIREFNLVKGGIVDFLRAKSKTSYADISDTTKRSYLSRQVADIYLETAVQIGLLLPNTDTHFFIQPYAPGCVTEEYGNDLLDLYERSYHQIALSMDEGVSFIPREGLKFIDAWHNDGRSYGDIAELIVKGIKNEL